MALTDISVYLRHEDSLERVKLGTTDLDDLDTLPYRVRRWAVNGSEQLTGQFFIDEDHGIAGFELVVHES